MSCGDGSATDFLSLFAVFAPHKAVFVEKKDNSAQENCKNAQKVVSLQYDFQKQTIKGLTRHFISDSIYLYCIKVILRVKRFRLYILS